MVHFGELNYLWGNIPAFDVLNVKKNEGEGYAEDIDLCFAGEYGVRQSNGPYLPFERVIGQ